MLTTTFVQYPIRHHQLQYARIWYGDLIVFFFFFGWLNELKRGFYWLSCFDKVI